MSANQPASLFSSPPTPEGRSRLSPSPPTPEGRPTCPPPPALIECRW
ncbi:MAG: hypothetical protein MUC60_13595 [Oscillatoria sp. Prado101]|nr:hypothetical protein [Oscillatoria sp. Prado101]